MLMVVTVAKKLVCALVAVVAGGLALGLTGCTGSKPGATPPAQIADFPGEDTRDGGRPNRVVVEVDQREDEGGD